MAPTPPEVIAGIVSAVLDAPGDHAVQLAASWLQRALVAERVEVHLLDRRHERLHLAAASPVEGAAPCLPVRGSPAGQAVRGESVMHHREGPRSVVRVPLTAFGNCAGVLTVTGAPPSGPVAVDADATAGAAAVRASDWRTLAGTLALVLHHADATTDEIELVRRTHDFSVAAELQWQLMPPAAVATDRFGLRALVEPAPRVTSDLYDWSLNGSRLSLTLLDAAGRGLPATQAGDLALAALRNARRAGRAIAEQAALADQALWDRYGGHAAVAALLVEIDLDVGAARALDAGSPYALRRRGHDIDRLELAAHDPLGLLERSHYRDHPVDLRPGDTLLAVSDGVPTAQSGRDVYGLRRVADHLHRTSILRDLPTSLISDLRAHVGGALADDATVVAVEWHHDHDRR